jgi:hypothetical protein
VFYPPTGFVSTLPEEWLLLTSLAVAAYLMLSKWEKVSLPERETMSFVLAWLATTWVPYFLAQLVRATYPFYMLQMLPAAAIANAWMMTKFPKPVKFAFVAACLIWLVLFFPMTQTSASFLPFVGRWLGCLSTACPGGP